MQMTGRVQRMTIYFGESDRWQGKPLYMALLETLRGAGLAGATVTRAVAATAFALAVSEAAWLAEPCSRSFAATDARSASETGTLA